MQLLVSSRRHCQQVHVGEDASTESEVQQHSATTKARGLKAVFLNRWCRAADSRLRLPAAHYIHSSRQLRQLLGNAVQLYALDTLVITAPSMPDNTLCK
jgi:hypothetical protein